MTIQEARKVLGDKAVNMSDSEIESQLICFEGLIDIGFELMDKEIKEIGIKAFNKKWANK